MNVYSFNGRATANDAGELFFLLSKVRKGTYGAFILSHRDSGPSLWVHINGDIASLHFFMDTSHSHPGFQPTGMTPPGCEETVHFIQVDGGEADSFDMVSGGLVPVATAYKAASEFLADGGRPSCVSWEEMCIHPDKGAG